MFGAGFDPKKMQAMMKQLGMKQEDIDSTRVIIEKTDGSKITIEGPSVAKITMQGQETWQISGGETVESSGFSEDDIATVVEKTGVSESEAKKALEETNGDLAEAIMNLS